MTDSIMAYFEGPEKKIEIILDKPQPELRRKNDGRWNRVVHAAGAEILNCVSTAALDAYLLSESSLFVSDDRLLLITCGQTAPVKALPEILSFVDRKNIAFLFYERKNLNFPKEQATGADEDFTYLSGFVPVKPLRFGPDDRDHVHLFYYGNGRPAQPQNSTLRVMMHDIDPSVGQCFTRACPDAARGIDGLMSLSLVTSNMVLDTHFFEPQGYSLNGVARGEYLTVHVTPEHEASYTSLETNIVDPQYPLIIDEITRMFRPSRFCVFIKTADRSLFEHPLDSGWLEFEGFAIDDTVDRRIDRHFKAIFQSYRRNDGFT